MKTTCPPSSDQLAALVLGALDPAAERPLRDHVAACPACAQRLRELTALAGELAAVPAPPADFTPSPDFHRDWVRRLPAANPSASASAPRRPAAKGTGVGALANWVEYWRQLTAGWRAAWPALAAVVILLALQSAWLHRHPAPPRLAATTPPTTTVDAGAPANPAAPTTLAQYLGAVNHSPEALDALLSREALTAVATADPSTQPRSPWPD